jgi:DNA-directed RNA polymerase specialized sigma24 family protein
VSLTLSERRTQSERRRVALRGLDLEIMRSAAARRKLARSVLGCRVAGVSRAEIARRLDVSTGEVDRLARAAQQELTRS